MALAALVWLSLRALTMNRLTPTFVPGVTAKVALPFASARVAALGPSIPVSSASSVMTSEASATLAPMDAFSRNSVLIFTLIVGITKPPPRCWPVCRQQAPQPRQREAGRTQRDIHSACAGSRPISVLRLTISGLKRNPMCQHQSLDRCATPATRVGATGDASRIRILMSRARYN